jgi:hypothetical protein
MDSLSAADSAWLDLPLPPAGPGCCRAADRPSRITWKPTTCARMPIIILTNWNTWRSFVSRRPVTGKVHEGYRPKKGQGFIAGNGRPCRHHPDPGRRRCRRAGLYRHRGRVHGPVGPVVNPPAGSPVGLQSGPLAGDCCCSGLVVAWYPRCAGCYPVAWCTRGFEHLHIT